MVSILVLLFFVCLFCLFVCFFLLLSFEGLDSWKDNVWIWFCRGILWFLHLWWLRFWPGIAAWAGICVLLVSYNICPCSSGFHSRWWKVLCNSDRPAFIYYLTLNQARLSASLINAVSGPVRLDLSRRCVPLTRGLRIPWGILCGPLRLSGDSPGKVPQCSSGAEGIMDILKWGEWILCI